MSLGSERTKFNLKEKHSRGGKSINKINEGFGDTCPIKMFLIWARFKSRQRGRLRFWLLFKGKVVSFVESIFSLQLLTLINEGSPNF